MRPILALLLVPTALVVVAPPAGAADPTPTCDGRAATIVGERRAHVVGTEGDDVIVADRPFSVDALGGDDLICVTGAHRLDFPVVDAGPGDDTVDTHGQYNGRAVVSVDLGPGRDTFVGGDDADVVDDGDTAGAASVDTIDDGGGGGIVRVGAKGATSRDQVTLGPYGNLVVRGTPAGHYQGASHDSLTFRHAPGGRWDVDLTARTSRVGASTFYAQLFEDVDLDHVSWTHLRFRSGSGRQFLSAARGVPTHGGRGQRRATVDIGLGHGSDTVRLDRQGGGRVSGGSGQDFLDFDGLVGRGRGGHPQQALDADLGHRLVVDRRPPTRLRGFEHVDLSGFRDTTLVGTPDDDDVVVGTCTLTARLGAGDDVLGSDDPVSGCPDHGPGEVVHGGPGHDRIYGGALDDHLDGGPGRDLVVGGGGHDVCVAERVEDC